MYLEYLRLGIRNQFNSIVLLMVVWQNIKLFFDKYPLKLLNIQENSRSIVLNLVLAEDFQEILKGNNCYSNIKSQRFQALLGYIKVITQLFLVISRRLKDQICIFLVIYQDRKQTRLICIKSMLPEFLSFPNVLATSTIYEILHHNYFFFLLVHLRIVIFQLYKTKDKILLIQA